MGACSPRKFLYFQTVLDRFWWYFDLYFTSFEVRTRWFQLVWGTSLPQTRFQLLCRHRRYATRENATPLYLPRPRNERAPHYQYAIRIVYWYVSHPLRIQRTETKRDFFIARSRVGHGVRKKELSAGLLTRTRHGHVTRSRHGDRHHGYKHDRLDRRAYLTTVCCQEKWWLVLLLYTRGVINGKLDDILLHQCDLPPDDPDYLTVLEEKRFLEKYMVSENTSLERVTERDGSRL